MRYGIRIGDFDAMLAKQKGLCAICGNPMKRPCVDHNHETGEIRGLLCYGCNVTAGFVEKRLKFLPKLLAYLGNR